MSFFPIIDQIRNYKKAYWSGDLFGGLTVGVMLIPQGMAYAMLAGMPPIYGLYVATLPPIIYAILGTSRQLSIGPTAMESILIASGVGLLAQSGTDPYIELAILLSLIVGVIQLTMGALRMGFLVNFLSRPVIAGFTSAAALIIGVSQLKHLLGIDIPRGKVHETIMHVFPHLNEINLVTLAIGLGAIAVLIALKRINKRIPGALVVVLLGIGMVYGLGLAQQGVQIVRDVPGGLPGFAIPMIEWDTIKSLLPIAFAITFVSFMESTASAKALQQKHKDYEVVPNKELIALGMANIGGSFFRSFPISGGFSRSAVNNQAGAKTTIATIISSIVVILTLLFLTDYFYYLPNAVLASIIMVAVFGLIDIAEARHLWKVDKIDFSLFMITTLSTLFLGIEEGILTGVVLSLGIIISRVSYPHIAELGQIPGEETFRNLRRFDDLIVYEDMLILRFDAQLFFANANALRDWIKDKISDRPGIRHVIIESSAINNLDSTAVGMIKTLGRDLQAQQISLYFSDLKGPVRDILARNGILTKDRASRFFLSTNQAVEFIKGNEAALRPKFTHQSEG